MRYIKTFKEDSDYESYINGGEGEVFLPNVSYCKDTMGAHFNPYVAPPDNRDIVGSVALFDKVSGNIIYVLPDDLISYNSTSYTPIGVVVIPASHDVYGTGECGIMSVMEMSYSNPEKGSSSFTDMYWGGHPGGYGTDLSLPNLDQVPLISTALTSNEITGVTGSAYLPSTKLSGNTPSVGSGLDTLAGYYSSSYIPSPYLEDGSRNPSYYTNDTSKYPGLSANCLSDFDGVGNTAVITAAATAQTDWKTASAITNSKDVGYYPAACCCYRFNPDGNTAGKWYLPAMGELGYMMVRFNEIQNSLTKIQNQFGSSFACLLDSSFGYCSSSEYSSDNVRSMMTKYSRVGNYGKLATNYVRAFFRA